jgi:pyruvate dehydrogenase E1 component
VRDPHIPQQLFEVDVVDPDPQETEEWREALLSMLAARGPERVAFMLDQQVRWARQAKVPWRAPRNTPYVNTIAAIDEPAFPGDLALEERLASLMRWNALAMVVRANRAHGELGGHIASYASAADLFEVGFNHFFRAGDLVFYQAHSAPGVYARAYLEGRLGETDLLHYRQEITAAEQGHQGLASYPHPWSMPGFWQFPTGSMGLGPISSIYHARFMRYLEQRGIVEQSRRRVWGVFGDGEMDEPESMAALTLAARENLTHLVWVINCNLQRLDGPVRGNGRIIDELEALFEGAGWRVIKLLWGSDWDGLFARDRSGALSKAFATTVDGQLQTFAAKDGRYNREQFFGRDPHLAVLVQAMSDDEIDRLKRGGHDLMKIYAAYHAAAHDTAAAPTVILAQTKKGYGMGTAGQGRMTTHQQKKLDREDLLAFRDRFDLPLDDDAAAELRFYKPGPDSPEARYLHARRAALGGSIPVRSSRAAPLAVPALDRYARFALQPEGREMSTTMAFVRMLAALLKEPEYGTRVVPIVADEARTFGMANLFRQVGIYSSSGQRYEPEDIGSILSYREARDGQILEEGITEVGALSSWIAAATSYSVHGVAMLPFYIYYSMFGFQRVGDLIWAAADQRSRGFLIGATSGRTTLGGEGLQHQDGSSHLVAATVPNCRSYDPASAAELAVIVDHGMREMLTDGRDVFYYVTVTNESYAQRALPAGVEADVIKGMYRSDGYLPPDGIAPRAKVHLLGAGAILREVLAAGALLAQDWAVESEVWSVTSFGELERDAREGARWNRLHPLQPPRTSHVARCLAGSAPVVAATDYVRAHAQLIAPFVGAPFVALGTDGFGRSDTRAALRRFFEVDRYHIVVAALHQLVRVQAIDSNDCAAAIKQYGLPLEAAPPWTR